MTYDPYHHYCSYYVLLFVNRAMLKLTMSGGWMNAYRSLSSLPGYESCLLRLALARDCALLPRLSMLGLSPRRVSRRGQPGSIAGAGHKLARCRHGIMFMRHVVRCD